MAVKTSCLVKLCVRVRVCERMLLILLFSPRLEDLFAHPFIFKPTFPLPHSTCYTVATKPSLWSECCLLATWQLLNATCFKICRLLTGPHRPSWQLRELSARLKSFFQSRNAGVGTVCPNLECKWECLILSRWSPFFPTAAPWGRQVAMSQLRVTALIFLLSGPARAAPCQASNSPGRLSPLGEDTLLSLLTRVPPGWTVSCFCCVIPSKRWAASADLLACSSETNNHVSALS